MTDESSVQPTVSPGQQTMFGMPPDDTLLDAHDLAIVTASGRTVPA
jgi:hypothetical protein